MTNVSVDVSTSLDGYVAGPNGSPENPLGDGGTPFRFVTNGIEIAMERARTAAGEGDVLISDVAVGARRVRPAVASKVPGGAVSG